jgi:hypothetical protein
MKNLFKVVLIAAVSLSAAMAALAASQEAKPAPKSGDAAASTPDSPAPSSAAPDAKGKEYSGMYTFLKEGEFVQVTVEDAGQVTGFISRFGDSGSGKSDFVDQFFKTGKLEGSKLSFTTTPVSKVWYEFKGAVERGEGKTPDEEAYYVLRGTLTENTTGADKDKKVTSRAQDVAFKMFPQDAEKGAEKDAEKAPDAKN